MAVNANFRDLRITALRYDFVPVHAVLFDLGLSSHHRDEPGRGFRFAEDSADRTPLDMRMDQRGPPTAADLLHSASVDELARIFREFGDLRGARRLARAIGEARRRAPLRTTRELLDLIDATRVGGGRRHHPATRVFQALRIAVNDELAALEEGLESAIDALRAGGRLAVLAYHSAEDRIVKNHIRNAVRGCDCPPRTPICICGGAVRLRGLTRRPVVPTPAEVRTNPRSRSARLRGAERVVETV